MTDAAPSYDVAVEALARAHETHEQTTQVLRELRSQTVAADPRTVVLDASKSIDTVPGSGRSIAVLNPNPLTIFVGIGGGRATPAGRGIPVPPQSLLVWPVDVTNVEIGLDPADPDLGVGTAVVHVLLFAAVQPAFLGKWS